ncbi:MAG: NYN domain-containing protein [Xanthomonadales bacterium]|jgi:uncharacterized LabA/DUF88 family protein|nr:NYN domain-containing protein [Xanthomonadales bacterium]
MDRVAVFVDAGYLFGQGCKLLFNAPLSRGEMRLKNRQFVEHLARRATEWTGLPLLRIYWYDGSNSGPTRSHLALSYLDNVKMRLGFVSKSGRQKGIDALLISDLVDLSRNRAICDAVILSGDEDLRVGVLQAQNFGIRVHLLGIQDPDTDAPDMYNTSQSSMLRQEADTVRTLMKTELAELLERVEPRLDLSRPSDTAVEIPEWMQQAIDEAAAHMTEDDVGVVANLGEREPIPGYIDRSLLGVAREYAGRPLEDDEKRQLRARIRVKARGDGHHEAHPA